VHAPVDPAEVGDEVYSGPAPIRQRVEQTDLDMGVGIQGGDDRIVGLVVGIVDEEPNPDPTVGRLEHVIEYDPAGGIAVPDVVLHVQALLGQVGQRQTGDEGLTTLAHKAESGEARMLLGGRAEELAQLGGSVVLERRRWRARIVGPGTGGAAGESQAEPDQHRVEETATCERSRLGRTRRDARPLRVGAYGRSAAHEFS
jgi:hypothetical protein